MNTPTTPDADRAARRATVRQLAQQDLSHRAIAARLGISKDTVRRDLAHPAPTVAHTEPEVAHPARATESQSDAPPAPPAPPAEDSAPPAAPTRPFGVVRPGAGLTVLPDVEFADDLAVLMSCGRTAADAIGHAVSIVAGIYRNAWARGVVLHGQEPCIVDAAVLPQAAGEPHGPEHVFQ
ncbi:hypothetical protein [Streptomyces chryseus]